MMRSRICNKCFGFGTTQCVPAGIDQPQCRNIWSYKGLDLFFSREADRLVGIQINIEESFAGGLELINYSRPLSTQSTFDEIIEYFNKIGIQVSLIDKWWEDEVLVLKSNAGVLLWFDRDGKFGWRLYSISKYE